MKKITIREIAEIAQTAPSTVQRALSGKGSVDPETRKKIIRIAEKHHYLRKHDAPHRWALLLPHTSIKNYYESELIISLSSEILSQGDSYVIVPCENTSILHEIFFDGVFTFVELNRELLRKISPLPTIAFNNFSLHKDRLWSVVSDDEEMSRRAVNYFYSKGHRSIGLWILPDTHNFSDIRREKYFRQAIAELGLKPYIYYWGMGELEESEFTLMVKDKVTAMFLPGEFAYLQLDLMLKAANHRIPEQFSLIMLENRRFTPYIEPPLTTFEQDFRQMSKQALALAKQIANGASGILRNQKIPYLFHERSSVAEISQSC